jgi:L-fucose mutarotase
MVIGEVLHRILYKETEMISTKLTHPEILKALASAGHGSKVVLADSNYPFSTGSNPNAVHVYLNLTPGTVKVTEVLEVLIGTIPIEAAHAIQPDDGSSPPIFDEYRDILPDDLELATLGRYDFYATAKSEDTALIIATGEQRTWACIILTIGVIGSW